MKKKIYLALLCFAAIVCISGCSMTTAGDKNYNTNSNFVSVEGSKDLYYYSDTGIIYVIFNEASGYQGYGYAAPYYSENGNLCKYIDGQIIELTEESDSNE